jgi:hypothetical protein
MTWPDIASAILRCAHLAALASLFRTLVFDPAVLPRLPAEPWTRLVHSRLGGLARDRAWLALAMGAAGCVVQATMIAGAESLQDGFAAFPIVALDTRCG